MRIANRISSLIIIIFGLYIIYEANKMDYMVDGTPGPGFLPLWLGIAICLVALIPLGRTFTRFASKLDNPFEKDNFRIFFVVIGCAIAMIFVTQITGMLVALGLMVGAIAKLLGTQSWKKVIGLTIFTPTLLYGIFRIILDVPLPKGIFGF